MYSGWVSVIRWVDGDTFNFAGMKVGLFPHGGLFLAGRVRPLGFDAPERGQPGYKEALEFARETVPEGSPVDVQTKGLDSFGRLLAEVFIDDKNVCELLAAHTPFTLVDPVEQLKQLAVPGE